MLWFNLAGRLHNPHNATQPFTHYPSQQDEGENLKKLVGRDEDNLIG